MQAHTDRDAQSVALSEDRLPAPLPAPLGKLPSRDQRQWWWLTLGCLVVGGLGAARWRTTAGDASGGPQDAQGQQPSRVEILAQQLSDSETKVESLRAEIEQLRWDLSEYEKAAAEGQNLAKQMNEALQRIKIAAGLTPVKGPGIAVELSDAPVRVAHGEDQSPYLIHDIDLLQIVNELRAAKAEAIAINGQRLTATSEVRCSGPVTRVNGTSIVPPYDVRAIGDPKILKGALELPGGVLEILRPLEIQVKITLKSEVELPPADVGQTFEYLKPVEPDE